MKEFFEHGDTVRLVGMGTPSQRNCLWTVDGSRWKWASWQDVGSSHVKIHRQDDEDCWIYIPREHITHATILDLLVEATDG